MRIWPSYSFELKSPLTAVEAQNALAIQVEPQEGWTLFVWSDKYFRGKIVNGTFEMKRTSIFGKFLPLIDGEIQDLGSGSLIKVTMGLDQQDRIASILWATVMSLWTILAVYPSLISRHYFALPVIPIGLICFWIFLMLHGFWSQTKPQRDKLKEIFHA